MKNLILLLTVALSIVLAGCQKNDNEKTDGLAGTTWKDGSYYLTFTSERDVIFKLLDEGGDVKSAGTYTRFEHDIVFSNISLLYKNLITYTISSGTISGNEMVVSMTTQFIGLPKTQTELELVKQ